MKKLSYSLMAMAVVIFLNSCGVGGAYLLNQNQNSTQVHLSNNNYKWKCRSGLCIDLWRNEKASTIRQSLQ